MPKRKPPTDAPPLTPRTPMQDRIALNRKVKMFYDLQRLRIQAAGRGLKKGDENPIQLHEHDVYVLNSRAESLHAAEKAALRDIDDHLKTIPFYVNVLSDKDRYRGIGPTMAGVILSSFDIYREDTASKMWSFCGLAPVEARRCKACFTLVEMVDSTINEPELKRLYKHVVARAPLRPKADAPTPAEPKLKCPYPPTIAFNVTVASAKAMRPTKGEKLPYNAFLKTKLVGVLGPVMLKVGSPWRKQYDDFKNRWASASPPKGRNDGHRHQAAIRYMIKMLLLDIWREWRTALELPVREAYAVEKQGRPVHNGGAAHVAPAPAADGPSYDAEIAAELGYLEENGGAVQ